MRSCQVRPAIKSVEKGLLSRREDGDEAWSDMSVLCERVMVGVFERLCCGVVGEGGIHIKRLKSKQRGIRNESRRIRLQPAFAVRWTVKTNFLRLPSCRRNAVADIIWHRWHRKIPVMRAVAWTEPFRCCLAVCLWLRCTRQTQFRPPDAVMSGQAAESCSVNLCEVQQPAVCFFVSSSHSWELSVLPSSSFLSLYIRLEKKLLTPKHQSCQPS